MTIFLSVLASNNSARSPICILYINSGIYICMCVYITILFTNHPRMYTHAFILVVSILCVFEGTLHTFFLDKKRRKALSSARSDFIVDTAGNISAERFTLSFARARVLFISLSLSLSRFYSLLLSASSTSLIAGRPFFPKKPCCLPL
jgi:hypothetical protein